MKRKKIAIYILLIAIFTLVLAMISTQALYAHPMKYLTTDGEHVGDCGTNQHSIYYDVQDWEVAVYVLNIGTYEPPGWNSSGEFYKVVWKNVDGETFSVDISGADVFTMDGYTVLYNSTWSVAIDELPSGADIVWIKIFYTGDSNADCIWVRTMPMTCWQVWINEDNNFEFIFWYPYKSNNWVRIYDMEGNLVYEVEILLNEPRIVVDIPDGMYTVKTFWMSDEPIQEFIIGKPLKTGQYLLTYLLARL